MYLLAFITIFFLLSAGSRAGTQGFVYKDGSKEDSLNPRRLSTLLSQGRRDA